MAADAADGYTTSAPLKARDNRGDRHYGVVDRETTERLQGGRQRGYREAERETSEAVWIWKTMLDRLGRHNVDIAGRDIQRHKLSMLIGLVGITQLRYSLDVLGILR